MSQPPVANSQTPRRLLPWLVWGHVIMVLIGVGVMYLFALRDSAKAGGALPRITHVPNLAFTDQDGRAFELDDLKGLIWIGDLIYTTCPGPCPIVTSRLAGLQKKIARHGNVRLVSISVTPEIDTPERLRDYAREFGAGSQWKFLTGDPEGVARLATDVFRAPLRFQDNEKEPVLHTTQLVVVDQHGYVRALHESLEDAGLNAALRDAERLRQE